MRHLAKLCLVGAVALVLGSCSNGIYGSKKTVIVEYNGRRLFIPHFIPNIPDGTDYGLVALGTSEEHTFRVTNQKATKVTFTADPTVLIEGVDSSNFVLVTTLPGELDPDTYSTFKVSFTPTKPDGLGAGSVHTAIVMIPYEDEMDRPGVITITLIGTSDAAVAAAGEVEVQNPDDVEIVSGDDGPTAGKLTDFGNLDVDLSEVEARIFSINNVAVPGSGDITLLGTPRVAVTGIDADQFTIVQPTSASIAAGAEVEFTITFAPTIPGEAEATIVIVNDDTDEAVYWFVVKGTGTSTT